MMSRQLNLPQPRRRGLNPQPRRPIQKLKPLWIAARRSPPVSLLPICFSVSFSWQDVLGYSLSSMVGRGSAKRLELVKTDTADPVTWISSCERYRLYRYQADVPRLFIYRLLLARACELCTVQMIRRVFPRNKRKSEELQHRMR